MSHALRSPRRSLAHRRAAGFLAAMLVALAAALVPASQVAATSPVPPPQPPQPSISGVAPAHGPAAGGNEVVVSGSNLDLLFDRSIGVYFGSARAEVLSFTSTTATVKAPAGLSGTTVPVYASSWDRYTAPWGSTDSDYTYDGRPRRSLTLSPSHGSPLGSVVTLTGQGIAFKNPRSVTFGDKPAEIVSSTDTSVTVKSPPNTPGETVVVALTTAAGDFEGTRWNRFKYALTTVPPTVTSLSASPAAIDDYIRVRGSAFTGLTSVTIDGEPTYARFTNDEEIFIEVPRLPPGTYDVVVTTLFGSSENSAADDLEILADEQPILEEITPNHGPASGGTWITIRGRNLGTAYKVLFGSGNWSSGPNLQVISDSEIRVRTPEIVTFHDTVDVVVVTDKGGLMLDAGWKRDDFAIDPVPGNLTLSPNHGPAGVPTTVAVSGAGSFDMRRVFSFWLLRDGQDPIQLGDSADLGHTVKIPAGAAGQTARVQARTYEGTPLNGDGDPFRWDDAPGTYGYAAKGQASLKTLVRGTFGMTGSADLDFAADGSVHGPLTLADASARLVSGGFLPVTAKLAFAPSGEAAGILVGDGLRLVGKFRLKVKELKLFGAIPLIGGNSCQTRQLATIDLAGPAFTAAGGGRLTSSFTLSDLNGCGALNGLVSPLTAGGGNTLTLDLTPRA